jgi:hypothetical protein
MATEKLKNYIQGSKINQIKNHKKSHELRLLRPETQNKNPEHTQNYKPSWVQVSLQTKKHKCTT